MPRAKTRIKEFTRGWFVELYCAYKFLTSYASGMTCIGQWMISCILFVFGALAEYAGNTSRQTFCMTIVISYRINAKLETRSFLRNLNYLQNCWDSWSELQKPRLGLIHAGNIKSCDTATLKVHSCRHPLPKGTCWSGTFGLWPLWTGPQNCSTQQGTRTRFSVWVHTKDYVA